MKHQVALVAGLAATTMCPSWGSTSVLGPIEQDIKLGEQTAKQISQDPREYPILSESKYPGVYEYLNGIKQTILDSGAVKYAKDFAWQLQG